MIIQSIHISPNWSITDLSNADDVGSDSDQTSHEEDIKIKQEIVFSNNPGSQHQPTLEIFEIELKNMDKKKQTNQYSDPLHNFDDYNHKVVYWLI